MPDTAHLETYRTRAVWRSERWQWRLVHANGNVLARSSEGYTDEGEAQRQGFKIVSGQYTIE